MDQTPNLQLLYIMPSQAQKHVTHNEAIRALDALVQMAVLDRNLATPPLSLADGDRYLIAPGGLGAWAGKDGDIAAWQDGAWAYFAPEAGWLVWVADESRLLCHNGLAFVDAAVHSVNPALLVGVNSTADATDRLSVKSPASLFDHEGGDHRMKINKETAADTASMLFQSGYSGRAEFGLTGDDDWSVKVSPNGIAWVDALKVDRSTGRVRLPAGLALGDDNQIVARRHVREKLAANRTYYVRTDGSDLNTGLANTAGGAFVTMQKAIDVIAALDISTDNVTIQVADGTYPGGAAVTGSWLGSGTVTLLGNVATPANVLVGAVSSVGAGSKISVSGLKFSQGSVSNSRLYAFAGGAITIAGPIVLTPGSGLNMMQAQGFGSIIDGISSTITVEAGICARFAYALIGGYIQIFAANVTLVSTPTFSFFADAQRLALINAANAILSGAATGTRYNVSLNGVLNTGGGGASFLPGSVAGTTATGGQYA